MQLKMKELPTLERPYEKLEIYGAEMLSNAELLAIIIKTGNKKETAVALAQKILNLDKNYNKNDLRFLQDISIEELMAIKGIGKVKAIQIKAVSEIARRITKPTTNKIKINNTKDVAELVMSELRYEKREIAKVIILNNKNIVLRIVNISLGGSNFACIEPKDVLAEAIKMQAPKIILIHNHPSGDPRPSKGDYKVTDRIYECADLMGIELLDHVVIGDGTYESVLMGKEM
ncbi:MAG: DNA repair protein RadC [Clostridia bacterium]